MIKAEDIKPCGGVSTVVIVEEGATSGGIDNANLAALAGLVSAADKLPYFTGAGAAALADLSSFVRTLLPAANAAAARAILGVDLTAPGPIGAGTPSTGAFTDLVCETLEVTNGLPLSAMTDTWDDIGTAYTGLGLDITDTASNAASLVFDFKIGGSSRLKLSKTALVIGTNASNVSELSFAGGGKIRAQYNQLWIEQGPGNAGIVILGYGEVPTGGSCHISGVDSGNMRIKSGSETLQLGTDHATAPAAQTVTGPAATTGNTNGGDITIQGGAPSGSGTRGSVILNGGNRAAYDAAPSATTIRDILISHGLMAAA